MINKETLAELRTNKIAIKFEDANQVKGFLKKLKILQINKLDIFNLTPSEVNQFPWVLSLYKLANIAKPVMGIPIYFTSQDFDIVRANQVFHNNLFPNNNKYQKPVKAMAVKALEVVKKVEVNKIDAIESSIINSNKKIRLEKFLRKDKGISLKVFLQTFFCKLNNEYNTIYYEDRKVQTPKGKRRSLADLFLISKYYFPKTRLKEVLEILYSFENSKEVPNFRSSFCNQIKKRTFYKGTSSQQSEILQSEIKDEFSLDIAEWKKLMKTN
jgi:hypothetical protein